MNKQELKTIIDGLIKFGEDKDELIFWYDSFDDLEPDKQKQIFENFKKELEKLEKIGI